MLGFSALAILAAIILMILALQTRKKFSQLQGRLVEISSETDDYDRRRHVEQIEKAEETLSKVKSTMVYSAWGSLLTGVILGVMAAVITVPAGHTKVASLFGKVQPIPFPEGLHIINPLLELAEFDVRQKTHKETAGIPSEDKLITQMDVSVQYRTIAGMTPDILQNTGRTADVVSVHLVPKLRSILREQGKGVSLAQDFFLEATQTRLQASLQVGLSEFMAPKGIQIDNVLIRNIVLPEVIRNAITETKEREQQVVKQQAELDRFSKEQEQKIATAEAEYQAALLEAKKIGALADAEAYRIKTEYTGRAEGIQKLKAELTGEYISYLQAQQWNGVLPVYTGGESIPMIDLR